MELWNGLRTQATSFLGMNDINGVGLAKGRKVTRTMLAMGICAS